MQSLRTRKRHVCVALHNIYVFYAAYFITEDFSQRVQSQHMSQMSQFYSTDETAVIARTTTLVSSQPPAVADVPRPPKPDAALRAMIDKPSQPLNTSSRTQPVKNTTKASSTEPVASKLPVCSDSPAPTVTEPQQSAIPVASPVSCHTSSSSNVRSTEFLETRQEHLIQALEKSASLLPSNAPALNPPESSSSSAAPVPRQKRTKRKVVEVENIDTADIDLSAPPVDTNKRLRTTHEVSPKLSSKGKDELEVNETNNDVTVDVPNVIYLRKALPSADGWFESQLSQGDTAQRRLHLSQHASEETFPEPNIIECGIRLGASNNTNRIGTPAARHANDKRRFRKNWVKVSLATHKISAEDMERVFPKETEREIQVVTLIIFIECLIGLLLESR